MPTSSMPAIKWQPLEGYEHVSEHSGYIYFTIMSRTICHLKERNDCNICKKWIRCEGLIHFQENALELYDKMPQRGFISWNAMIAT